MKVALISTKFEAMKFFQIPDFSPEDLSRLILKNKA